eukprot:5869038-Pyramimonas_sp.AAC.1
MPQSRMPVLASLVVARCKYLTPVQDKRFHPTSEGLPVSCAQLCPPTARMARARSHGKAD